jgi:hypothetical protein
VDELAAVIDKVRAMPTVVGGDTHHIASPFKQLDDAFIVIADVHWGKAKLRRVDIAEVFSTSPRCDRENVILHLENGGTSVYKGDGQRLHDAPRLIQTDDGDLIIADGHHRLAADWWLGLREQTCWVLKVKTEDDK